ncbi:MAG: hypothetical protein JWP03_1793, partial [Phycisphaerales bacterium]|nr:hypothetical protein [Phycisphaerales bacterium]
MCPIYHSRTAPRIVRLWHPLVHPLLLLGFAGIGCAASSPAADPPAEIANQPAAQGVTYWPVSLEAPEGRVEIYQPQPEVMKGDMLTARVAVSLARVGANPQFGAAWFTAHAVTDRDTRMVTLREVTVKDARLPGSTPAEQQDFARAIGGRLSAVAVTFPLDQLTASLDTAHMEKVEAERIQTTPPHILISTTPATLVLINGPPRLQAVGGQPGVSQVANTPFILLFDGTGRRYYLKAGERWVSAPAVTGPWANATDVPPAIANAGAQLATPPPQPAAAGAPAAGAPAAPGATEPGAGAADAQIIVATEPTELIVTTGNPQFT